ncbi:hypothetical protein [Novosphingobium sp. M1R2S20]|uniref:Uncharacterized protein n=1 Tax=Novosphingobium rhizovicinum TaxID=3228928 RepID=A0ABV3RDJ9_9SPHN
MIRVDLPYPHKLLWPNGRTRNPQAKPAQVKKHRQWAHFAALAERDAFVRGEKIGLRITVHAKPRGPLPDKDNVVSAVKAYQDGIAAALGIDDKHFETPVVEFATPRTGRFVIEIGAPA